MRCELCGDPLPQPTGRRYCETCLPFVVRAERELFGVVEPLAFPSIETLAERFAMPLGEPRHVTRRPSRAWLRTRTCF